MSLTRWITEVMLAAIVGVTALAFPMLTGQAHQGHSAAFLPFMADVAEGVQGISLLLLFVSASWLVFLERLRRLFLGALA